MSSKIGLGPGHLDTIRWCDDGRPEHAGKIGAALKTLFSSLNASAFIDGAGFPSEAAYIKTCCTSCSQFASQPVLKASFHLWEGFLLQDTMSEPLLSWIEASALKRYRCPLVCPRRPCR